MRRKQETMQEQSAGWRLESTYARLPQVFFSEVTPTPVAAPRLAILNTALANRLGLDPDRLASEAGVEILAGNRLPEGSVPLAQAYAGHQFGHFTRLGDGRAVLLGEHIAPDGLRFDIQLKGSGRTPYSRDGDGRAALGPMLREYLVSEAMAGLGIPTTRSLAVVTTGETIWRDQPLAGAVLTRVASSHLRVGTFEHAAALGNLADLRALADYAIERHFPGVAAARDPYLAFLAAVLRRQARLAAQWQGVGFIHGVLNTDNLSISGETIDYGPCAFMDAYDPATVFSSIDLQGRYAYGNQPRMVSWNLARFAETLLPLLDPDPDKALLRAQAVLNTFAEYYQAAWLQVMRDKLGLRTQEETADGGTTTTIRLRGAEPVWTDERVHDPESLPLTDPDQEGDVALVKELLDLMKAHQRDWTNTFVDLSFARTDDLDDPFYGSEAFIAWHNDYQMRLSLQEESPESILSRMRSANPAVIARNHRVEEALAAAVKRGDLAPYFRLLGAIAIPYAHVPGQADFSSPGNPAGPDGRYRTFCGT